MLSFICIDSSISFQCHETVETHDKTFMNYSKTNKHTRTDYAEKVKILNHWSDKLQYNLYDMIGPFPV